MSSSNDATNILMRHRSPQTTPLSQAFALRQKSRVRTLGENSNYTFKMVQL